MSTQYHVFNNVVSPRVATCTPVVNPPLLSEMTLRVVEQDILKPLYRVVGGYRLLNEDGTDPILPSLGVPWTPNFQCRGSSCGPILLDWLTRRF
jgi:hypothetical protein